MFTVSFSQKFHATMMILSGEKLTARGVRKRSPAVKVDNRNSWFTPMTFCDMRTQCRLLPGANSTTRVLNQSTRA